MRVYFLRMRHPLFHAVGGDLMEKDPFDVLIDRSDFIREMSSDRFSLPVGVGGQKDCLCFAGLFPQPVDDVILPLNILVDDSEFILHVHAEFALREVFDVPHRCLDDVLFSEVLIDGLCLGRRFNDD